MAERIDADPEGLLRASELMREAGDGFGAVSARAAEIPDIFPAVTGDCDFGNRFMEGSDGEPGFLSSWTAMRDSLNQLPGICGSTADIVEQQGVAFAVSEEFSSGDIGRG
jgi:hypothetical protein